MGASWVLTWVLLIQLKETTHEARAWATPPLPGPPQARPPPRRPRPRSQSSALALANVSAALAMLAVPLGSRLAAGDTVCGKKMLRCAEGGCIMMHQVKVLTNC